ncbi:MAG: sulfatase [Bacteroidota bacterium]
MNFIHLRILCLISGLLLSSVGVLYAQEEKPRNIVFILIDDQRYDFLSFLDHPWIKTPHIDRLAENSLYFTHAYVTTSLCSPSRASILTGQYAHVHQVMDNDTRLPADTPTFPQLLQKEANYHTGFIGKWHMGGSDDMPRPGFDYWASFKGQGNYFDPMLNIDSARIPFEGYTPDILTDLAVEYLKDQAQSSQPFMLYLSHKSIHEDFSPAPRHEGAYKDLEIPRPVTFPATEETYRGKPLWLQRQRRSWHGSERDFGIQNYGTYDRFFQRYGECMLGVDESIGRITEALEELGILDETLVVYFSDNGYLMGEQGLIDKRVMYEPSIRVPAFIHCPALIPEGRVDDRFVLNIDFSSTFLDLAGVQIPEGMQGSSLMPLLSGNPVPWRQAFLYEYFIDLKTPQTPTIFGLRTRTHSYMTYQGVWDPCELYDMEIDPDQRENLLGDIQFGQNYGTFLDQIQRQAPEKYIVVGALEQKMDSILEATEGRRVPVWAK